ncbi:glycine zipper 2TM domain-containing protein [Pseudoduganella danionis]|uniref:Glycine zipper 2TM domain-containing protein n=1 Tax=Pseudoduganella danionis TaxID=1890295 RepID=A0ABW9SNB0_9BURK|nr:glycine zipper 2TM domain-containing protein [Pseudoduganella danionis]MTW32214.1 glycine zipper 2TM domain-containing protein [Pseudoduganella danionis]
MDTHHSSGSPATPATTPSPAARSLHPMILSAAVAVVLFCGVGSAAIMGWLPNTRANDSVPMASDGSTGASRSAPYSAPANLTPASAERYAAVDGSRTMPESQQAPRPAAAVCNSCGVISSIRSVEHRGQGTGVGAAGGAILGGLLGNQVGSGHGRQLATVAGAVGGAVAGNQVEGNMKTTHSWEITVRMDNGARRVLHQSAQPQWHEGDAVRIVNGQLRAN